MRTLRVSPRLMTSSAARILLLWVHTAHLGSHTSRREDAERTQLPRPDGARTHRRLTARSMSSASRRARDAGRRPDKPVPSYIIGCDWEEAPNQPAQIDYGGPYVDQRKCHTGAESSVVTIGNTSRVKRSHIYICIFSERHNMYDIGMSGRIFLLIQPISTSFQRYSQGQQIRYSSSIRKPKVRGSYWLKKTVSKC